MQNKKLSFVFLIVLIPISFSGCSLGQSDTIATVTNKSALTSETVIPTASNTVTSSPEPTSTQVPTMTSTPTSSPTASFTPSSTPDKRVFNIDPRILLIDKDDLPSDARYYLPASNWISPHRNSEIVTSWGAEKGKEYLSKTGRIDGWWAAYKRGSSTVIAPEEIYDNAVLYETSKGARLTIEEYSNCLDPETGYTEIETDIVIGDTTIACINREMQSNGKNRVWLRVEFVYRNVFHGIIGWGWESEVSLDYVMGVASAALSKLESQPLSDEVTYQP